MTSLLQTDHLSWSWRSAADMSRTAQMVIGGRIPSWSGRSTDIFTFLHNTTIKIIVNGQAIINRHHPSRIVNPSQSGRPADNFTPFHSTTWFFSPCDLANCQGLLKTILHMTIHRHVANWWAVTIHYYTLSSLSLFWLAESVQWIFEISTPDVITADYAIIMSRSRVIMSRSRVIMSCMTTVHDF